MIEQVNPYVWFALIGVLTTFAEFCRSKRHTSFRSMSWIVITGALTGTSIIGLRYDSICRTEFAWCCGVVWVTCTLWGRSPDAKDWVFEQAPKLLDLLVKLRNLTGGDQ